MLDFNYYNPAKIVFGKDSINQLEQLLKENDVHNLLLIYSGEFIKDLGIYQKVVEAAEKLNIGLWENGNVTPNPSVELVRELVTVGKQNNIDLVLAVGGGSSIDTAKAVAI